jgi:probable phosphoglycerate mutase
VRFAVISRHGQSVLNVEGLVNGNPALDKGLSELGRQEAEAMAEQLAALRIDLVVVSEFPRAQETAAIVRDLAQVVDPGLNDIQIGELEGKTLADYRAWKQAHARADAFPGGESLDAAAVRYADAFERVLARDEETILVVCHEIPVRYVVNAAAGSGDLNAPMHDIPNATPYVFDADGLRRAVARIRELTPA